jgi:hypothetical protein
LTGRSEGKNLLELGPQCQEAPSILKLLCNKIGLGNEELRPDRDNFVRILWQNVQPGWFFHQFLIIIINIFPLLSMTAAISDCMPKLGKMTHCQRLPTTSRAFCMPGRICTLKHPGWKRLCQRKRSIGTSSEFEPFILYQYKRENIPGT